MSGIFHTVLYQPLLNILVFFYSSFAFQDLGVSIILLTVFIRVIFYPLFYKAYKSQKLLQKIQPAMKKIQQDHKDNRARQAQELMALYKNHKFNPFSGFFLILIQLPILIALYRLFLNGIPDSALSGLYSFVARPEHITHEFLNLIDLMKPNIIVVGLAAAAQYFQGLLSLSRPAGNQGALSPAERLSKQMVVIGPVITIVILYSLPAAVGLYWLTTSIFSVGQQFLINRSFNKKTETKNEDSKQPNKTDI